MVLYCIVYMWTETTTVGMWTEATTVNMWTEATTVGIYTTFPPKWSQAVVATAAAAARVGVGRWQGKGGDHSRRFPR